MGRRFVFLIMGLVISSAAGIAWPGGGPARAQTAGGAGESPARAAPPSTPSSNFPSSNVPLPPRRSIDTEALNKDVKASEAFQQALKAELEAAKGDRGRLNQLLVETTTRARSAEQQYIEVEGRIAQLDRSAGDLQRSLEARRGVLAEVLAALMRLERNPPPALLLRPDDALDAVRSAILLGALLPELRVEAETLAADLSEQKRVRAELVTAKENLARLRAALDEDRKRVAALVTERQRRHAEENPVPQAERAQVDAVARGTSDVHDLVTRMESEVPQAARAADVARTSTPPAGSAAPVVEAPKDPRRIAPAMAFTDAKGLLPLPVAGVRLTDFGGRDALGNTEKGISIATRAGATVSAPSDGWVVYAGPFRSYGQLLIINAGGGYHILMAGMERITVDLGQFVLAGEPVGVMGARGTPAAASGQPQLYVEFRKDGVSIDPAPWWAATDSRKVRG